MLIFYIVGGITTPSSSSLSWATIQVVVGRRIEKFFMVATGWCFFMLFKFVGYTDNDTVFGSFEMSMRLYMFLYVSSVAQCVILFFSCLLLDILVLEIRKFVLVNVECDVISFGSGRIQLKKKLLDDDEEILVTRLGTQLCYKSCTCQTNRFLCLSDHLCRSGLGEILF